MGISEVIPSMNDIFIENVQGISANNQISASLTE
jgi:hypothetical protein